ncbi:glycerophosphoryl diester phosphodiesterase membrane domain-containing protein [Streptococcus acidominimus]|uniref:Glycerophosphodiester phosphodiesterase n=1 Tax=Streptococcus acidominimus TaxID=1326 RepID=A0A1Q8EBD9_STRAI|nr:glycerophosphoryl diester phosphodiesterase membrane domain-containing protein [Streptococcus acidominimus]OLF49114.1 glycosyltransferase [Streptococcus acidominimus]SUN07667.1 glycerophosphodiester phosphodiesterase [Streptococcus acidominimus]
MAHTPYKASETLAYKGKVIWLFIKYQLLTKSILALIIYPIYFALVTTLLHQSGRTVISSGDFIRFLLSFNGFGLMIATMILLMMLVALDINSFILISALIEEGKVEMTVRHILRVAVTSLKEFLTFSGLAMMIYIALIFPIIGLGITVSPMQQFQIPNFITSVIYANPLYLTCYSLSLLVFTYISYRFIFVFHYILIQGKKVREALKSSAALTKTHGRRFLKDLVVASIKKIILPYLPLAIAVGLLCLILLQLVDNPHGVRFLLMFTLLSLTQITTFVAFIVTPLLISIITHLFYLYNEERGNEVKLTRNLKASAWLDGVKHRIKLRNKVTITLAVLLVLVFNLLISAFLTYYFEEIFNQKHPIEVIAHRAGGNLGAENTLQGIAEATKQDVSWTEIDVQRTKDGFYILNHDADFKRVAGDPRTSSEMTLKESKGLKVNNEFDPSQPAQPVPTIEEVLDVARGKIGLFIELKGKTADKKMVDDMVALIKAEKMEKEAVLLSLDYEIIEYIEATYPEIQSGYLYYFALGQIEDLKGDYLIMEEREAKPEKVALLKAKGKKVVVWTVNTDESIRIFVNSDVDGIITDDVLAVKEGLKTRDERSDLELIIDSIFG